MRCIALCPAGRDDRAAWLVQTARAGGIEVEVVSLSPNAVLSGAAGAWQPRFGSAPPGALAVVAFGLDDAELIALATLDVLGSASAGVTLVVPVGAELHGACSALVERAAAVGLGLAARAAPVVSDGLDPSFTAVADGGLHHPGVLAASADVADEFRTMADIALIGALHGNPGAAQHMLGRVAALHPEALVIDHGVVDPVLLADGVDLPDPVDLLLVDRFEPARPWLPDATLGQPRVTTVGRPRLSLALERIAAGWAAGSQAESEPRDAIRHRICREGIVTAATYDLPDGDSVGALDRWLREPALSSDSGITRALLAAWRERADLQAAFPDPGGRDRAAFARWAPNAVAEGMLEPDLLETVIGPVESHDVDPGVVVTGYLDRELGLGGVARDVVEALRIADVPASTRCFVDSQSPRTHPIADDGPLRETSIVVSGLATRDWLHAGQRPEVRAARRRIGVWFWEADFEIPGARAAAEGLTEIWTGSAFVRDVIAGQVDTPVRIMPIPVDTAPAAPLGPSTVPDLAGRRYALFVFDFLSVVQRKNPHAAIEAFTRAFGVDDDVVLLLKTINGDRRRADLAELLHRASQHRNVLLHDGVMPRDELRSLMGGASSYLSLHRSEGYGMTIAESMALGVPTIATAYSGNLQFTDAETGWLVPYELMPIGAGAGPYPPDGVWAEADVDSAAAMLIEVMAGGPSVRARADAAQQRILEQADPRQLARFMTSALT